MKLLLVFVMAGALVFDFCESSFWDQNQRMSSGPHRLQQMPRDRPRPLRHHRHIQAHNYHRPLPRSQRPMPPPGHRRRSPRPPPPRHGPIKSYRPQVNNQGSMFLQSMNHNSHPPRQSHRQHFSGPPALFQQDEILNEQSNHFPTTVVLNEPHASQSFQRTTEMQPHGYLSSTYKGWKPIVKPFQDAYLRQNKLNGKEEYPRKQEFNVGPQSHNSIDNMRSVNMHGNLNLNTLFRENTERLKSGGLQSEYSENQGVRVPVPPEVGRPIRLPQSFFMDAPWNTQFQSQSEEIPVIKKPFPKFQPKPKSTISPSPSSPIQNENAEQRPNAPKFKFNRPRPRIPQLKDGQSGNDQEVPTKSPIPQFTQQSEEVVNPVQSQTPLNLKAKLNNRGRVRVRTKVMKPFSEESEEPGLPAPRPLQPFEPSRVRNPSERPNLDNSPGLPQPGPPYPPPHGNNIDSQSHNNRLVNKPRNHTDGAYESPYPERGFPERGNTERNHAGSNSPPRNHPERNNQVRGQSDSSYRTPQPAYYEKPDTTNQFHQSTRGPPQTTESELKPESGGQQNNFGPGGRRRRPKNGNKNVAVQQQQSPVNNESPAFTDDFHFPPGFSPDPSKNTGQHPVSFMTMPGSKPQVIHHTYESHRPQTQQQLYPINVIRSPDSEYQRPNHDHGTHPNGNYVQNNRPRFVIMNAQNGAGQSHSENSGFHNQQNVAAAYPSNHESTYAPHAFGSNISPYTIGTPFPPPLNRNPAQFPRQSAPVQNYSPQRQSPSPATTARNPYFQSSNSHSFSVPYETSPSMNSFEVSESSEGNPYLSSPPYVQQTSPSSFLSTSPRTIYSPAPPRMHQHQPRPQPTQSLPQYSPSFGSAEYDKIPMQYVDQLRPILRDEPVEFSSTTPNVRQLHRSPEVHPPPNFFSDFFKPFDEPYNRNPEQDLDQKSSSPVWNQIRPPFINNGFEPYRSPSTPSFHVVPHPATGPSTIKTTASSRPFSYSPQIFDGPMLPSVSSTHRTEYDETNTRPSQSWSTKVRDDGSGVSSTENIIHRTSTVHHHKKIGNKVNQNKQHPHQTSSTIKTEVEPTKTRPRRPYGDAVHELIENIPAVTTYKPSSSSTSKKVHGNLANEGNSRRNPVSNSDSTLPLEDDLNDSNTPRSVRVRNKDKPDSAPSHVTESPEDSIPSTTFKSRRQFRRRRPESLVRRRYFSSRVKPETDIDEEKVEASNQKPQASQRLHQIQKQETDAIDQNDDGHDSSRVSVLRHRRLFHRRKVPVSTQRFKEVEEKGVSSTSIPSSTESEAVTYGESQWFRIKPADSSEEPIVHISKNKEEHPNPKATLKSLADKGKYKSKPVELVPLESTTTEISGEELDRTPFSLKHSAPLKGHKFLSKKEISSKRSM